MLKPAPVGKSPESKWSPLAVTVCVCEDSFVQWTLYPARMVTLSGSKSRSVILIWMLSVDCDGDAAKEA